MSTLPELSQVRDRVRRDTDYVNSAAVTDADLNSWINDGLGEFHDLLVSSYNDYFVNDPVEVTVSSGNKIDVYSEITDFYKLKGIDYKNSSTDFTALEKFNFNRRNRDSSGVNLMFKRGSRRSYRLMAGKIHILPESDAVGTYRIWYVPSYTPLVDDNDTFRGENGWDKYVVLYASIEVKKKFEEDAVIYIGQLNALKDRIKTMAAQRDTEGANPISDHNSYLMDDYLEL